MDEDSEKKILGVFDVIIGLIVFFTGGVVFIFGIEWMDYVSLITSDKTIFTVGYIGWFEKTAFIPILISIVVMVYGIKKIVYAFLKS